MKKVLKRGKSSNSAEPLSNPKLAHLKSTVLDLSKAKEAMREATNDANRKTTSAKNALLDYLSGEGAQAIDGVVLYGMEYAFRPGDATMINPRDWYALWQAKKISDNQYFGALSVSIGEAKKAIGEDQIPDISIATTTKEPSFRVITDYNKVSEANPEGTPVPKDGTIVPYKANVPSPKEAKTKPVITEQPKQSRVPAKKTIKVARNG